MFTIQEFKVQVAIDNLDIYELETFMRKSKLIFKVPLKNLDLNVNNNLRSHQNIADEPFVKLQAD